MKIIDANYILRWFLADIPDQSATAAKLIRTAHPASLILDRVTIAEITYVLRAKGYDHRQIFTLLQELYYYPSLVTPSEIDWHAIELFGQTTLDFEDCLLLAHHQIHQTAIVTFDKELLKKSGA